MKNVQILVTITTYIREDRFNKVGHCLEEAIVNDFYKMNVQGNPSQKTRKQETNTTNDKIVKTEIEANGSNRFQD